MPFTFAHPVAVLPLRRFKYLQTVPLIVGSVAPDLPYYIPARFNHLTLETHTPSGSLWADIPIGLVVLTVGFLLRRPLTTLMTARARALCLRSMERFRDQPLHWVLAPLSILVGTWTHLLWDSFTHDSGWMVRRVAALSAPITLGAYTGTLCHVLQYVSSVAGLLILAIWYRRLPTPALEPPGFAAVSSSGRLVILILVSTAAAGIGIYIAGHAALVGQSNYRVIYLLLTRAIAWFAFLYLAAGLLVTFSRKKPEPVAEM
jgi:preprotein translocase subunit SecG